VDERKELQLNIDDIIKYLRNLRESAEKKPPIKPQLDFLLNPSKKSNASCA
jgi:hypothetical protein